jgi:hypothetical protein
VEARRSPRPDDVALELAEIQARLAAMVSEAGGEEMASELGKIRADLRRLAAENDEIRERLAPLLWDEHEPH